MNDIYSNHEWIYKPRFLAASLREAVGDHPVIVLLGARQAGKSTLLSEESPFRGWRYVSLDDFDSLAQSERDPAALWAGTERVVVDEVQKSPALLPAVKQAVDRSRRRFRFALSGSSSLVLMQKVTESLAGRAVSFTLQPMCMGEELGGRPSRILEDLMNGRFPKERGVDPPAKPVEDLMLRGFLPPLPELSGVDAAVRWWEGYVATYLERDLRALSQVSSLADFRRVMQALALRSAQVLNQTTVSREVGISQPSVHRYVNLLETTTVLVRLPAYTKSRTKRLVKSPKVYFLDPGLAAFLAGHHHPGGLSRSREIGAMFETLVLLHLRVGTQRMLPRPKLFYWRTVSGREVDFVVESGRKLLALEAKLTPSPRFSDADGLRTFLEEHPDAKAGILVHTGPSIRRLDEKITAVPWWLIA
jgi:hypothetical protein